MFTRTWFVCFIVALLLSFPVEAKKKIIKPKGKTRISFGPFLGLAIPSTSGVNTQMTFGLEAEYEIWDHFSAGLYFSTFSNEIITISTSSTFVMAQFNWHFNTPKGLWIGTKMGANFSATSGTLTQEDPRHFFSMGFGLGYDYIVGRALSIGPEANYLFGFKDGIDGLVNILCVVKYRFR